MLNEVVLGQYELLFFSSSVFNCLKDVLWQLLIYLTQKYMYAGQVCNTDFYVTKLNVM